MEYGMRISQISRLLSCRNEARKDIFGVEPDGPGGVGGAAGTKKDGSAATEDYD